MPVAASPEYAQDFVDHLATLSGGVVVVADGATRNMWAGRERSTEDGCPDAAVFVQEFGGYSDLHTDGRMHWRQVSVLTRASSYQAGLTMAKHIHDRMDLIGGFTVNGRRYMDCRADGPGPSHLDVEPGSAHEYFEESFTLWAEQL